VLAAPAATMLTNVRRFIGYLGRRSSWLFMKVLLCVKVGVGYWKSSSRLFGNCRENSGNNGECSQHRHRSLRRDGFSSEPFPVSMFRTKRRVVTRHRAIVTPPSAPAAEAFEAVEWPGSLTALRQIMIPRPDVENNEVRSMGREPNAHFHRVRARTVPLLAGPRPAEQEPVT
jgi:hypothetical protein